MKLHADFKSEVVYWLVPSLLGFMVFPTILVFLGSVPVYFAVSTGVSSGANEVNALDFIATGLTVSAALIQVSVSIRAASD